MKLIALLVTFLILFAPGIVLPEDMAVPNCRCVYVKTPTPTPTRTPTRTPSPTKTATPTKTAVATKTSTATPTSTATQTAVPTVTPYPPTPVPGGAALAKWESDMLVFGKKHCDHLKANPADWASTYYDGGRVFYQIADYTGDSSWLACAEVAKNAYRDSYVVANGGGAAGWWNFSEGLAIDWIKTGSAASKNAIGLLATKASYCLHTAYEKNVILNEVPGETSSWYLQREVSYCGMTLVDNQKVGNGAAPDLAPTYLEASLGYLDRQFVKKDTLYVKPFMAALGAEFLIRYYEEVSPDPRIIPALQKAADAMWIMYKYDKRAMLYMSFCPETCPVGPGCPNGCKDDPGVNPAPDLNNLIAPLYAWLWKMTGNSFYADAADQLFTGGVEQAYISANPKHFFQAYRWSFDYVKWRSLK